MPKPLKREVGGATTTFEEQTRWDVTKVTITQLGFSTLRKVSCHYSSGPYTTKEQGS